MGDPHEVWGSEAKRRNLVLSEVRSLAALEMTAMEFLLWITAVHLRREMLAMNNTYVMQRLHSIKID
jgi:hypothetical protein